MGLISNINDSIKESKIKKYIIHHNIKGLKNYLANTTIESYIFNRAFSSLNDELLSSMFEMSDILTLNDKIIECLLRNLNDTNIKEKILSNENMYKNLNGKSINYLLDNFKYSINNNKLDEYYYNILINSSIEKQIELIITKENIVSMYYLIGKINDKDMIYKLLNCNKILEHMNTKDIYNILFLLNDAQINNLLKKDIINKKLFNSEYYSVNLLDIISLYKEPSERMKIISDNNLLEKYSANELIKVFNIGEEYIIDGKKYRRFKTNKEFFSNKNLMQKYRDNINDLNILLSNIENFKELKEITNTLLNIFDINDQKEILEGLKPREYSSTINNYESLLNVIDNNKVSNLGDIISLFNSEDKLKCIINNQINSKLSSFDLDNIIISETGNELINLLNNLSNNSINKLDINYIIGNLSSNDAYNFIENKSILNKIKRDNNIKINDIQLFIYKLYSNNNNLFKTLNINLLIDEIMNLDFDFVEKLTKHPDFSYKIRNLYRYKKYNSMFFEGIYNALDNNNIDSKVEIILNTLENIDISLINYENMTEKDYILLANYLLKNDSIYNYTRDKEEKKNLNDKNIKLEIKTLSELRNYEFLFNNKCDKLMKQSNDLEELKNIYFNKYLNINYDEAKEIIRLYSTSINKFDIDKYYQNINYINHINYVFKIEDIDEIKQLYLNNPYKIDLIDTLKIDQDLRKMFVHSISSSLIKSNNIKPNKNIEISGQSIKVYEPKGNFNLLVNSTAAYGRMDILNDNYFDSWNKSERTKNHGICCSYISNSNLGIANVYDILIGFDDFSDDAIELEAPYDLYSINDKNVLYSNRRLLFLNNEDLINYSRFLHNELVLERKEKRNINNNLFNIQPSYVIIFDYFSDNVKENCLKASKDLNVPIIYLDTNLIASKERKKIDNLIENFKMTKSLKVLEQIITLHENNSNSFINQKELRTKYFESTYINDLLSSTIKDTIKQMKRKKIDYNKGIGYLKQIKILLKKEDDKFNNTYFDYRKGKISIKVNEFVSLINNTIKEYYINIKNNITDKAIEINKENKKNI